MEGCLSCGLFTWWRIFLVVVLYHLGRSLATKVTVVVSITIFCSSQVVFFVRLHRRRQAREWVAHGGGGPCCGPTGKCSLHNQMFWVWARAMSQ